MILLLIASTLILASGILSIVHSFLFDLENKSIILYQTLIMMQSLLPFFTHFINLILSGAADKASKLLQST